MNPGVSKGGERNKNILGRGKAGRGGKDDYLKAQRWDDTGVQT